MPDAAAVSTDEKVARLRDWLARQMADPAFHPENALREVLRRLSDLDPTPAPLPAVAVIRMARSANWRRQAEAVVRVVAKGRGETVDDICGQGRSSRFMTPRHITAWLLRRLGLTLQDIGEVLGGRDHSTTANAIKVADGWVRARPAIREEVATALAALGLPPLTPDETACASNPQA